MRDRQTSIKFKLMPDGHIRAFQSNTADKRGVSESQIYPSVGISPTITVAHTPKLLIFKSHTTPTMEYKQHPTKEDLLEYFGQRIRVRKMTPREALRLMDVADADIDKMMNATETVTLKDSTVKVKKAISKTALYRLAGNSIVVSCLYHIFRTLFIDNQPENELTTPEQLTLF